MNSLFPVVVQGYRFYAGIGSRETPQNILLLMAWIGEKLSQRGYVLRSGGAQGADKFFASEVSEHLKEIFIPWKGFQEEINGIVSIDLPTYEQAKKIAESFHPAWERCSSGAKKLLTRNVYQILGRRLNEPVDFIICWTKDGKASGGTGQAIRIAENINIPVYNLKDEEIRGAVLTALGYNKETMPVTIQNV